MMIAPQSLLHDDAARRPFRRGAHGRRLCHAVESIVRLAAFACAEPLRCCLGVAPPASSCLVFREVCARLLATLGCARLQ